jgi:hypothetical protein
LKSSLQLILLALLVGAYSICSGYHITKDTTQNTYTVSLITCGVGDELYACFGHSAVRIINTHTGNDLVYNFGMFDFNDPNFYSKYIKGNLMYYGSKGQFQEFMYTYQMEDRAVQEQVLNLNNEQAIMLEAALEDAILDKNKYFHYDFLYKNCSTKLRDLFANTFKSDFQYQQVIPEDSCTFIQTLDYYLRNKHWERFGIDLLLSSEVNKKMNTFHSMFLPTGLHNGFAKALINGHPLVKTDTFILEKKSPLKAPINMPLILLSCIGVLFIGLSFWYKADHFMHKFDIVFFTLLGLLGLLFLFMWLGTNHLQTMHNLNILWALPTHITFYAWIKSKWHKHYIIFSLFASILSLILLLPYLQHTAIEIFPIIILVIIRWYKYLSNQGVPQRALV